MCSRAIPEGARRSAPLTLTLTLNRSAANPNPNPNPCPNPTLTLTLKAPGFCNIGTERGLFTPAKFADASAFIDGSLYLTLKSSTPAYKGFKVDFGAKNLTRPSGSLSHGGTSAS